jgi:hypothetical protein
MKRARAWMRAARARVGRRGSALLFFALLDLVLAASLAGAPAATRSSPTYAFLSLLLPLWAWALVWAAVGVVCLVQAFMLCDRIAFACASWLKVGWGVLNLTGWLLGEIPRGYVSAVIWLALASFVALIASWPEPPRRQ